MKRTFFKLGQIERVCLGRDSVILKTNKKLLRMKTDSEKEEKKKQRLNKFKLSEADEAGKPKLKQKKKDKRSDETQKTVVEKLKSIFCGCTSKKIKDNPNLEKKNERSTSLKISTSNNEQSHKPQKTMLEKIKSVFCCCKIKTIREKLKSIFRCCKRKKIKDNPRLKKFNYGIKRPKNNIKRLDKSLRRYIKQKLKLVIFLIVVYIIIFGAIVSISITVNYLSIIGQNETKQERF